jgi:RND family efflux transporter MFP subunit
VVLAVAVLAVALGCYFLVSNASAPAEDQDLGSESQAAVAVEVTHPRKGAMERTTVQPGTVQAYQSADLYAAVSGYLKVLNVDIGDRVKKGQVLAKIAVPDLEKQVERKSALLEQAGSRVGQMKARVVTARAEREAAKAAVVAAEAKHKSAQAWERFRNKQYQRMKSLFAGEAIKEQLVDEAREQFEAAAESTRSALASISATRAEEAKADAKIQETEADVSEAQNEVKVAQADLEEAQVQVQFATLTSPYNGVITRRTVVPGDFVRAATGGGLQLPLLAVEQTDRVRVVVQIPDRDVPYADPGDPAAVEIDALPGKKFPAKVSRIAASEDPDTRLMRVEIDLPNPKGRLRQGMYGRVTIVLDKGANLLSIPSASLVGKTENGVGTVYVVKDGRARRVQVLVGTDNGVRVAILRGLTADDLVIRHPPADLADGVPVTVSQAPETARANVPGQ